MTALDRLTTTGAITRPPRARARDWRSAAESFLAGLIAAGLLAWVILNG